jgi:hypothetical protein
MVQDPSLQVMTVPQSANSSPGLYLWNTEVVTVFTVSYLFVLFICDLINNPVSSKDYIASNSRMINKFGIDVEGSGRGLI